MHRCVAGATGPSGPSGPGALVISCCPASRSSASLLDLADPGHHDPVRVLDPVDQDVAVLATVGPHDLLLVRLRHGPEGGGHTCLQLVPTNEVVHVRLVVPGAEAPRGRVVAAAASATRGRV